MQTKHSFAIALFAFLSFASASAETVFLETEAFADHGGWKHDTQFMDQMGSPYLLAHGMGKPVADAKTAFVVRASATYDVWVRTKNWLAWVNARQGKATEGATPGTFKVAVNGTDLPSVLGVQGQGEWLWTKAGSVSLSKGPETTVALRALDEARQHGLPPFHTDREEEEL